MEEVSGLVLEYYLVLRSVLRSKSHLRPCLTRCRHCRIFFLTHPRNAGRRDLGCPFGCREEHRQKRSDERSAAYYKKPEGQMKKKFQNGKRRKQGPTPEPEKEPEVGGQTTEAEEPKFDPTMVDYVRMVTSLLEGREVSWEEIVEMLKRTMRQHSIGREKRIDYILRSLKERPP
jgi:hypothetical protein